MNTNIYTQKKQKQKQKQLLFSKDEVYSSLVTIHLLWAGFFGVLAEYIFIKVQLEV